MGEESKWMRLIWESMTNAIRSVSIYQPCYAQGKMVFLSSSVGSLYACYFGTFSLFQQRQHLHPHLAPQPIPGGSTVLATLPDVSGHWNQKDVGFSLTLQALFLLFAHHDSISGMCTSQLKLIYLC